jgi:hypothetical protein
MSGRPYIGPYLSQPVGSAAALSLHNQSAAIAPTGIIGAHAGTGLWRASCSIVTEVSGTAGTIQLLLSATQGGLDPVANFYLPPIFVVGGNQSGSVVFVSDGSADINYSTLFVGVTVGALKYGVRVVLEQLSNLA